MRGDISDADYRGLAELRYRIRKFLAAGDAAARHSGMEPQQYLLLLAIRGLSPKAEASIQVLAERMFIKHHSAVEMVDRLERQGYVRRTRGADRRKVLVSLLPRGERTLERVVRRRVTELRSSGAALVEAIGAVLKHKPARPSGATTGAHRLSTKSIKRRK